MSFNHVILGNYIMENFELKTKKQFELLKNLSKESVDYFETSYIIIPQPDNNHTNINNIDLDLYESEFVKKYNSIIVDGYTYIAKLNFSLMTLKTISYSQTNKIKFEECCNEMIEVSSFISSFNTLYESIFTNELDHIHNKVEIMGNIKKCVSGETDILPPDNLENWNKLNEIILKKKKFEFNQRILIYNDNINQIILTISKVNAILSNVSIGE